MRNRFRFFIAALAVVTLAAGALGCQRGTGPQEGPTGRLAVAGFMQPRVAGELLGGYIPENAGTIPSKVLTQLDSAMTQELEASRRLALGPSAVRQCSETVLSHQSGSGSAFDRWLAVGRCMDVEWLIIPQVTYWRERDGSDISVREPASVTLALYLLDVKNESFVRRYRFEETQQPLTSNFLETGKFFDRGGKWITALELAREGIAEGLKEFGL